MWGFVIKNKKGKVVYHSFHLFPSKKMVERMVKDALVNYDEFNYTSEVYEV